jgi:hypothetical protein
MCSTTPQMLVRVNLNQMQGFRAKHTAAAAAA